MGFGGPAYPRGYENMGIDKRERWERPGARRRRPRAVGRTPGIERAHEAGSRQRQSRGRCGSGSSSSGSTLIHSEEDDA